MRTYSGGAHHGRKVDFGLVVVPGEGRPQPPADMTKDERGVWREIVSAMPPNWFTTQHILRQYCRVVCMVEATSNEDVDALSKLTAMMLSLASKLRITPQAECARSRSRRWSGTLPGSNLGKTTTSRHRNFGHPPPAIGGGRVGRGGEGRDTSRHRVLFCA